MPVHKENYHRIRQELEPYHAELVAVSKTKRVEDLQELYAMGHRDFGENYVQEMVEKQSKLPQDIRWHFIGHLQSNKVKYIAPFVHLIHGIDSLKLLKEVNKQAGKNNRVIEVLLQVHIAREETKFGFDEQELLDANFIHEVGQLKNLQVKGLMGMASFNDNKELVRNEFRSLKNLYESLKQLQTPNIKFQILSMGMSSDYKIALEEGSNMVRIGSLLFGSR